MVAVINKLFETIFIGNVTLQRPFSDQRMNYVNYNLSYIVYLMLHKSRENKSTQIYEKSYDSSHMNDIQLNLTDILSTKCLKLNIFVDFRRIAYIL